MQVLANMQWLSQETKIVRELASTHSGMEGGVGSGGMGMGSGGSMGMGMGMGMHGQWRTQEPERPTQ